MLLSLSLFLSPFSMYLSIPPLSLSLTRHMYDSSFNPPTATSPLTGAVCSLTGPLAAPLRMLLAGPELTLLPPGQPDVKATK